MRLRATIIAIAMIASAPVCAADPVELTAALVDVPSPRAMPWGAWQFCLTDIDGNRLTFTQWPRASRRKEARSTPSSAPASGTPSRG